MLIVYDSAYPWIDDYSILIFDLGRLKYHLVNKQKWKDSNKIKSSLLVHVAVPRAGALHWRAAVSQPVVQGGFVMINFMWCPVIWSKILNVSVKVFWSEVNI